MGTPTAEDAPPARDAVVSPPPEPFEAFYRGQVDRVYRALAVALGDRDLAREATDEAMLRAYPRWQRVGTLDNPGGWVFRVGLNAGRRALHWRRRYGARPAVGAGRHQRGAGQYLTPDGTESRTAGIITPRAAVIGPTGRAGDDAAGGCSEMFGKPGQAVGRWQGEANPAV